MSTSNPAFLRVWGNDDIRAALLAHMDDATMCSLRLTSAECCRLSTSALFARTRITFTPSALTRPGRMEALARIGHHIQKLTFSMAHTPLTFLPPLLSPLDGREVQFSYSPLGSESQWPKYGRQAPGDELDQLDLNDILTQQYPPIFHAATNVPSFIRTMRCMPNLRHLSVNCPDQKPAQRYRRDAVDYALISLRIAVERAPLPRLEKLTLRTIHPSALLDLRHMPGFGSTPAAGRRWAQIRKLKLVIDSWDFHGPQPGLDHLKIVDDYIRSFSPGLEKLSVTWNGRPGPCPLTLETSPLFKPPRKAGKLFAEVTSSMSPLPDVPSKPAMRFPRLKYLQVRNCMMSAYQVSGFLAKHLETVRVFDFQDIIFLGTGTWREAVAPLKRPGVFDSWQSSLHDLGLGGPAQLEGEAYETYNSHVPHRDVQYQFAPFSGQDDAQPARQSLQLTKASHRLKKRRVRRRRKARPETDTDTNTSADRSPPRVVAVPFRPQISAPIVEPTVSAPALSVPTLSVPAASAPAVALPVLATLQPTTYSPPPSDSRRRIAPPPLVTSVATAAPPIPPPLLPPPLPPPQPPRLPSSVYSTETTRSLFLPFSLPLSPPMTPPSPAGPMSRLSVFSRTRGLYSPVSLSPSPFPNSPDPSMPAPLSLPLAAEPAGEGAFPAIPSEPATPAISATSASPAPATPIITSAQVVPPPSPPRNSPTRVRGHLRRLSATIASVNPGRNPIGTLVGHHGGTSHSPPPPSSSGSGSGSGDANAGEAVGNGNTSSTGVQRDLVLEATHQSLADDAEKRTSTLRKAREAILTKLTREFCTSNSTPHLVNLEGASTLYTAGSSGLVVDSGPRIRNNRSKGGLGRLGGRFGGGANVETRRGSPGEQTSKTQLVPLMIFR